MNRLTLGAKVLLLAGVTAASGLVGAERLGGRTDEEGRNWTLASESLSRWIASLVTSAVGEMDKVTQQNAASAEESSGAASELNVQAEELAAMASTFQLGEPGERGAPLVTPRSRNGISRLPLPQR